MGLFRVEQPVALPSGEMADFAHWINATDIATAQAAVEAWSTQLAGDVQWTALFPVATAFGECKVSEVNMATGATITSVMAGTAYAGNDLVGPLPPQISVVVTLQTAILSRSTRGRYYLPTPGHDILTAVGRIPNADQTQMLTSLVAAHTAEIGAGGVVTVYSRKNHSVENVTKISIGDVYDTQRRRRDKLLETRVSDAI